MQVLKNVQKNILFSHEHIEKEISTVFFMKVLNMYKNMFL